MINICIPVLNNYSGMRECVNSIESGTLKPDHYYILDNGMQCDRTRWRYENDPKAILVQPNRQISLSAAWNWFVTNVPETRIILNDDLVFLPDTLEVFIKGMSSTQISTPSSVPSLNYYSFFSIPDCIVKSVGKFDEEFYPAYFEDNSYDYRYRLAGHSVCLVENCNVIHEGSKTMKNYTPKQLEAHHKSFKANQDLYIKMWGGLPGHETYTKRYNGS